MLYYLIRNTPYVLYITKDRMNMLKKAKQAILSAKDIVIASHRNPDGDSIGSMLALGIGLRKLGKRVYMICQDDIPKRYRLLPGAKDIVRKLDKTCDLAITVDCSNKEILGNVYAILKKAQNILEIDHHEFRRPFGTIRLVDPKAAAVSEQVYTLLTALKVTISREMAENMLTSVIVETNSFRLPGVRPATFAISAELLRTGVDFYKLSYIVYWSKSKEAIALTGICFSRCRFLKNGKIVWSIVRKEDFRKVKGKDEDVDAVADEMRAITSVEAAVLFRENPAGTLRVSMRSKSINIAEVAEAFGGGGHMDLAGCSIPNTPAAIKKLLGLVEKKV